MLWLYLHFPHLPLDLYSRSQEKSVCLGMVEPQGSELIFVNPLATKAGIRLGMSTSTAYSLVPEINILTREAEKEAFGLKKLAQWAYGYSAQVSLKHPDGLLIEIGSMLRLFDGLQTIWTQMQQGLLEKGFTAYQAVAWTPRAAQLLAKNGGGPCNQDRAVLERYIANLDIDQSGLPASDCKKLSSMGLKRLGQIMTIPQKALGRRLGIEVLNHLNKIAGLQAEPQIFYKPPPYFTGDAHFILEIEQTTPLFFPLQRLLKELGQFMAQRQLMTNTLNIILKHRHQSATHIKVRCTQDENNIQELNQLCRLQLDGLSLNAPVTDLKILVNRFTPLITNTGDLFSKRQEQKKSQQQILSRLQAKLGPYAIQGINTLADHRPEKAWQFTPPSRVKEKSQKESPDLRRPLWLLPQPTPIKQHNIDVLRGPERIVSGWWDNNPVKRDYYIACSLSKTVEEQGLLWVFRRHDGQWFLQGYFG